MHAVQPGQVLNVTDAMDDVPRLQAAHRAGRPLHAHAKHAQRNAVQPGQVILLRLLDVPRHAAQRAAGHTLYVYSTRGTMACKCSAGWAGPERHQHHGRAEAARSAEVSGARSTNTGGLQQAAQHHTPRHAMQPRQAAVRLDNRGHAQAARSAQDILPAHTAHAEACDAAWAGHTLSPCSTCPGCAQRRGQQRARTAYSARGAMHAVQPGQVLNAHMQCTFSGCTQRQGQRRTQHARQTRRRAMQPGQVIRLRRGRRAQAATQRRDQQGTQHAQQARRHAMQPGQVVRFTPCSTCPGCTQRRGEQCAQHQHTEEGHGMQRSITRGRGAVQPGQVSTRCHQDMPRLHA